jgi:hypothetical protein
MDVSSPLGAGGHQPSRAFSDRRSMPVGAIVAVLRIL